MTGVSALWVAAKESDAVLLTPPEVRSLADTVAALARPLSDRPALGIACMTKRPAHFLTWLAYHRDHLGVRRFFVHVEDTPALAEQLRRPPWEALVDVSEASGTDRDYVSQVDRQAAHVERAIALARAAGLTHLLHIDDDELLYCAEGLAALQRALQRAPASALNVHVDNVEALLPSDACADPFREASAFRHRPVDFCAYGNGKAFGVLGAPALRPSGAHNFGGRLPAPAASETHALPAHTAVVLHYESATWDVWRRKFCELARVHAEESKAFRSMSPFYQARPTPSPTPTPCTRPRYPAALARPTRSRRLALMISAFVLIFSLIGV
jgi:hypothetical protein